MPVGVCEGVHVAELSGVKDGVGEITITTVGVNVGACVAVPVGVAGVTVARRH